ncbi:hypothetical protein DRQ29_01210 [bacterium]|nr:MAG: hypothetical protein DRQ29_01210 [bacterium]
MKRQIIAILSLVSILFIGCTEPRNGGPSEGEGSFETIFTDPYGYEETLSRAVDLIDGAEKTVCVESYGFELTDISESLINAHNRGVLVQIVCEGTSYSSDNENCFQDMDYAGIEIIHDNSSSISHNKVMIIDSEYVWTGSTNFTYSGYFLNNNNVIIIQSTDVALAYYDDFSQMFQGYFHGNKSSNGVEEVDVADGYVEVWFTPEDSPKSMLIDKVNNAQQTIEFCIYAYTLSDLADAMISAKNRGVQVRGIFDEGTTLDSPTQYHTLLDAGVDVQIDPCPYAFHHKFMVIDKDGTEPIVITGSGNWSINGTSNNDENFAVVHSASVAENYYYEFSRWWQESSLF